MKRTFKKIIYGALYLAVFGLMIWGLYGAFLAPEPTCFDGIQNQGEEGVDCGGPCIACSVAQLLPIRVTGEPQVFQLADGSTALLIEVQNPNAIHDGAFSYRFTLYDERNTVVDFILGSGSIYALEKKYFQAGRIYRSTEVATAQFEINNVTWQETNESQRPEIIVQDFFTSKEEGTIIVKGVLKNERVITVPYVKLIAFFYDDPGYMIFVSHTVVETLLAFEEKPFTVYVPPDKSLVESVNLDATRVVVHIE